MRQGGEDGDGAVQKGELMLSLLLLFSLVGVFGNAGIQKEGELLLLSLEEEDGVFGVGGKLEVDDEEGDIVSAVGDDE